MPTCWIIAGPNGAGKTTFAVKYLPSLANCFHFINADLIAGGLNPLAPNQELITAGRLFLRAIDEAILRQIDFAFETTLSGQSHLRLVNQLKDAGWEVELIYLALPSTELSKERVAERVAHGGHNVSEADIARRFPRSLKNLFGEYGATVDRVRCFMNDGEVPVLIFERAKGEITIVDDELFRTLKLITTQ